jgi:hypothetical protein
MSQHAGMTWNAAHVMIRLLLKMEYHVRTAYEVSCKPRILVHLDCEETPPFFSASYKVPGGHSGTLWALTSCSDSPKDNNDHRHHHASSQRTG